MGYFWKSIVVFLLIFGWGFNNAIDALQPPRPGEIEELRQKGVLESRVEFAKGTGNHKIDDYLLKKAISKLRRGLLQSKGMSIDEIDNISPLPAPPSDWQGMPTTGDIKIFALLIDFNDYPRVNSQTDVNNKIFGNGDPSDFPYESLRNYYLRSSYNLLNITEGATLGWYRYNGNRSDIEQTITGRENLIKEALNYFNSQGQNFSQYDNDNDGYIDYFAVFWAGPQGEWATFWWGQYIMNFDDQSYILDGKRLRRYSWQEESINGNPLNPVTVIHETGHALGLPDYYDYDETVGPDGGVGGLDMMDSVWGDHNSFSKWVLDWITPSIVSNGIQILTLNASATSQDAVIIWPGIDEDDIFSEFFVVQNRYRTGNDVTYPNDGMLIWHVDAGLNYYETNYLYDNSFTEHKLLRLMEADGLEEIEANSGADAGDFYTPGRILGPCSAPSTIKYDGTDSYVEISNISINGQQITATFDANNAEVCGRSIVVNKLGNGTGGVASSGRICINYPCSWRYSQGATVTLTPIEDYGSIDGVVWSGCDSVTGRQCFVTLNTDRTVTITFNYTSSYGRIAGRVTDGSNRIPNVYVYIYNANNDYITYSITNSEGNYITRDLNTGNYKVWFVGDDIGYNRIYYNGKNSLSQADIVSVSSPNITQNINASLTDTTPPDTQITSGPSGTITTNSAAFTYTGTDNVTPAANLLYATYLQGYYRGWSSFSSSTTKSYSNLPNGSYTFQVKAIDQAGNKDSTPATRSFTVSVDTTPPDTSITSGPSGTITTNSAAFTFTGTDNVTSTANLLYATYLQGYDSDWSSFSSSTTKSYSNLPNGSYTFQVKAKDQAGNEDPTPATRAFTVAVPDTTPPDTSITGGPSGTITTNSATFTFTGTDNVTSTANLLYATYLQGYDSDWSSFSSSTTKSYSNLPNGSYTFQVKAKDQAGNEDPTPATRAFTVAVPDTTPPDTSITGGPSGTITTNSATFTFTGTDNVTSTANLLYATYLQGYDSDWSSFSSSTTKSYSNLPNGSYTFQVKAKDQAGNEDPTPATRAFTVAVPDTTPPDTSITGGPSGTITTNSATFTFTGTDNVTSTANLLYATYLQGYDSDWSSFSSSTTKSYSNLPNGSYTFQVKAKDQAGNEDPTPATRSFTVAYSNRCDFNGDGKTDILWRNKSTGQNVVWLMNGTTYSSYAELLQVADTNWQIVGTGDFNGDGKTDILWRNKISGQNVIWLMNGTIYSNYVELLQVPDTNWQIVGTGDFNGDGKTDILWRNKGTGQNVVWYMNGTTYSSYAEIMQVTDTNWQIVGTGDFNGDGKIDIVWRNKSTGQNVVWYMNGATYSSYAEIMQVTDTNWQIVGTGDFNADGKVDILWRNKTTGQNVVWLMNGITYSSYAELPQVTDTNWEVVGPK